MGRSSPLLASLSTLCALAGASTIHAQEPWKHALDLTPGRTLVSVWTADPTLGASALLVDFDRQLCRVGDQGPVPANPQDGRTIWLCSERGGRLGRLTYLRGRGAQGWRTRIGWWAERSLDAPHEVELEGLWEGLLSEEGSTFVALERTEEPPLHRLRFFRSGRSEGPAIDLGDAARLPVQGLSLSADGQRLAVRQRDAVRVFDLRPVGAQLLYTLPGAGRVRLSTTGRYAALVELAALRLFDGTREMATFTTASPPRDMAFAAGWFAFVEDRRLVVRELAGDGSPGLPELALPADARLRSVDLVVRDGRPWVAVGLLAGAAGEAWVQVLEVGGTAGWRRWEAFAPGTTDVLSPEVLLLEGGARVLALTRDRIRVGDVR